MAAQPPQLTPELAQRMPRLLQAMEAIGGDVELHTMLDRIARTAAELADARYAALAVLNEDGSELAEFVTYGLPPGAHQDIGQDPGTEGLIRTLLESSGPLVLDDVAADLRAAGFPPGHPPMRTLVGVPIRVHGAGFGALYLADKKEGPFTEADLQMLRILATETGIAIGNARLYEAARQQARWMDGSLELSMSLLSEDEDPDHALTVVAEQARRVARASAAGVLEPVGPGGENGLRVVAVSADDPSGLLGLQLPPSQAVRTVLRGEPVLLDPSREPGAAPEMAERFGPCLILPLASEHTTLGVLAVGRPRGAAGYSVPERALATQFAQQAALALVLARARADREQLAVLKDRDRIARDLHDLVIQRLFAVGMILESARRTVRDGPEAERLDERIGTATRELEATIQEIRTTIFALRQQPEEAHAGLRTRVLREAGAAEQTLGFRPSVAFSGPVDTRVDEETARHLVAALREALSNAARHARASRIDVRVDATGEQVRLTVTDDGVGPPAPHERGRESGLRNLRHRAEGLGGSASLEPGPGGTGTTVTWQAPL